MVCGDARRVTTTAPLGGYAGLAPGPHHGGVWAVPSNGYGSWAGSGLADGHVSGLMDF
jgi:hypothetical protein